MYNVYSDNSKLWVGLIGLLVVLVTLILKFSILCLIIYGLFKIIKLL